MHQEDIIPTHADSYDTLNFVHSKCVCVYKKEGYTPLQVVNQIKQYLLPEEVSVCTYVGRLDPMAEGWMHVLWSGDAKEKEQLASLDKVYEVEVVLGIKTDTGDALGLVVQESDGVVEEKKLQDTVQTFIGSFEYPYPTYSSPHIKKTLRGIENHTQDTRLQKGNIFSIDLVSIQHVSSVDMQQKIEQKLAMCHMDGDFRLDSIQDGWRKFFMRIHSHTIFTTIKLRVSCSSGTYMRTLAEELGKKMNTCGFAFSIVRIGVGKTVTV